MKALLVDAGNTRVKWRMGERSGACATAEVSQLAAHWHGLPPFQQAWISNVAALQPPLQELFRQRGVRTHWVVPHAVWRQFRCAYDDPSQLGPDRWLAALAAWHEVRQAVLIVSVGTALTIDAVSADGCFIGGTISPGPHLMQRALATGTARLDVPTGQFRDFPTNTQDAIHSGIINALIGAVHQQYSKLAMAGSNNSPRICLCGGGAQMLAQHLALPTEWRPDLVLTGLQLLAEEPA